MLTFLDHSQQMPEKNRVGPDAPAPGQSARVPAVGPRRQRARYEAGAGTRDPRGAGVMNFWNDLTFFERFVRLNLRDGEGCFGLSSALWHPFNPFPDFVIRPSITRHADLEVFICHLAAVCLETPFSRRIRTWPAEVVTLRCVYHSLSRLSVSPRRLAAEVVANCPTLC